MPPVRKIKIQMADLFWQPFFDNSIQTTLEKIREAVNERHAILTYCECALLNYGRFDTRFLPKPSYRKPTKWSQVFKDSYEDSCIVETHRGGLKKPPHGTYAGFVYHFDDCPILVAKLLMQIASYDATSPKFLGDKIAMWQSFDPGSVSRLKVWNSEREAARRKKLLSAPAVPKKTLNQIKKNNPKNWREIVASIKIRVEQVRMRVLAEKPVSVDISDIEQAKRHHAEWHEIAQAMNPTAPAEDKRETAKKAKAEIYARDKVIKKWPSLPDFVPPEIFSTVLDVKNLG